MTTRRKPVETGVTRVGTKPVSMRLSLSVDVPSDVVVKAVVVLAAVLYRLFS